ncbi:MAG: SIR2 family protein [Candidatus Rokubacteria bacterium]|nr:SIR2 family protein [Candidatus Rokubacteria bacterium]
MPGHLFIVKGDVTRLACDAWLLPCDTRGRPRAQWLAGTPGAGDVRWPARPPEWERGEARAIEVTAWPADAPRPWLVNVGAAEGTDVGWFIAGASEFLDRVADRLRERTPRHGRAKPLVALPILGTGGGGAKRSAGDVVRELLPALRERARRHSVDVALVARAEAAFAAAQAERSRTEGADPWAELPRPLREEVERIAGHAARGRLVLFVGGGVGRGAGLPLWDEMLDQLAMQARMTAGERRALGDLDPIDRARIIGKRLDGVELGDAVARLLGRVQHHSISHALLAALPVSEIVTTNYDCLFEQASTAAGIPVRVLPGEPAHEEGRWLLKMHGSIDRPREIVLTREDYLRYEQRRAALAGIVQALLMTRHMLFVGFALRDDNFHRIADAVRKAIHPADDADGAQKRIRFGTALVLLHNPLQEELWQDDLHWTPVWELGAGEDQAAAEAQAGRRLEIFLDCLLARTSSVSYLLHPDFRAVLSAGERTLADTLREFTERVPSDARSAPAWLRIELLLRSLGLQG